MAKITYSPSHGQRVTLVLPSHQQRVTKKKIKTFLELNKNKNTVIYPNPWNSMKFQEEAIHGTKCLHQKPECSHVSTGQTWTLRTKLNKTPRNGRREEGRTGLNRWNRNRQQRRITESTKWRHQVDESPSGLPTHRLGCGTSSSHWRNSRPFLCSFCSVSATFPAAVTHLWSLPAFSETLHSP